MWNLGPEDQDLAHKLLKDNVDLYAANDMDLTSMVKHEINLKPGVPPVKDHL